MGERLKVKANLGFLKENMNEFMSDIQMRREMELDSQISDRFLR
jgi:hypothetical protein